MVKLENGIKELRADQRVMLRSSVEEIKNIMNRYYARHTMKVRKDDSDSNS
jgi:hypothetical protein